MIEEYAEKGKKTHVALITETWRQSAARDLTTFVTFVALWSVGHWAGNPANLSEGPWWAKEQAT
jgi:hypothetical protein